MLDALGPEAMRRLTLSLVDTLADLHALGQWAGELAERHGSSPGAAAGGEGEIEDGAVGELGLRER